ncbi:MAG: hypothetical protein LQ341_005694, partial [Variospora aurantia]
MLPLPLIKEEQNAFCGRAALIGNEFARSVSAPSDPAKASPFLLNSPILPAGL